jgi:two-component system nitrate/nitrite response regulator NarL
MTKQSSDSIRIFLVDNHTLVRAGLSSILEGQPDFKIVGQAGNPNEALSLIASAKPDIILLEFDLKSGLTMDVIPEFLQSWNKARIILVTSLNDRKTHLQAVRSGVMGIVLKSQLQEVLFKAIRKVHLGEVWIDHSLIANLVIHSFHLGTEISEDPMDESVKQLSDREREIIQFIGRGMKNKQIAEQLFISDPTVRHHLSSIYRKLGVSDRLELLIFAQRYKLTNNLS